MLSAAAQRIEVDGSRGESGRRNSLAFPQNHQFTSPVPSACLPDDDPKSSNRGASFRESAVQGLERCRVMPPVEPSSSFPRPEGEVSWHFQGTTSKETARARLETAPPAPFCKAWLYFTCIYHKAFTGKKSMGLGTGTVPRIPTVRSTNIR
jgi:hypothetical protein